MNTEFVRHTTHWLLWKNGMNWNDVSKELCRPECLVLAPCLSVTYRMRLGKRTRDGRAVMNENRLSFEPDNLQNNRATVLEQIYTLITSCRLLLASAIFPPFPCSMQHSIPTMLCIFIPRGLPTYTARTYDDYSVCSLARLRSLYSSRSPSMHSNWLSHCTLIYMSCPSKASTYPWNSALYPIAEETVQKLLRARSSQANAVKVVLATLSNGKLHL